MEKFLKDTYGITVFQEHLLILLEVNLTVWEKQWEKN
jgi:hypothetical protein